MDNEGTQSEDENTNDSYTDSKTGIDSAHGAMDCLVAVGRLQSSLDKPIGKTKFRLEFLNDSVFCQIFFLKVEK